MKEIHYEKAMEITAEHLADGGVFLNVGGETPNTMTIGWASVGHIWKKPVFMVLVRKQRHSHEMLCRAGEFTVSVPTLQPLKQELLFAGTKSGRDVNKFAGHGLTALRAQRVDAPIIGECGLHFECRTLLQQDLDPKMMDAALRNGIYAAGDYHTMFFGEILSCYTTDE